jgi:hypothetical protein
MRTKTLLLAGAFVLGILLTLSLSSAKAAGECEYLTTQVGNTITTKITFEYDCELISHSNIAGASFADPNWSISLSYSEPGGTGGHINEPSPHTVAVANGAGLFPQGDYVIFDQPISFVGFYYSASAPFVKLTAYDSSGVIIAEKTGAGNWGSCDNYSCRCIYNPPQELCLYDEWDLLNIEFGENIIKKIKIQSVDILDRQKGNVLIDDFTFQKRTPIQPDFFITSVKPVQVIERVDINNDGKLDLVQNKPTVVRIIVGVENEELINPDQPIKIELEFENGGVQSTSKNVAQILSGPVDFFITPANLGEKIIKVSVDASNLILESNEENNSHEISVTVKDMRGLFLAHLPVKFPAVPVNYAETVEKGVEFLRGTYPISPQKLTSNSYDTPFKPTNLDITLDFIKLWVEGKILSGGKADRVVGVATKEYLESYFGCQYPSIPVGVSLGTMGIIPSVLVLENFWTAEVHEIGHTYGLGEEYQVEKTGSCSGNIIKEGEPASGYWVQSPNNEDPVRNTLGFMGTAPGPHSFNRWVSEKSYNHLFDKFRTTKNDPEILLVSGQVFADGSVELQPMYQLNEGTIDDVEPGELSLITLDTKGNAISEISFSTENLLIADPFPPVTLDTGAFAFAIPYESNAQALLIKRGEEILTEVNITTKLIHDAIDNIPDSGFINKADQSKWVLHRKVDVIETQMKIGNLKGAVQKMENDVKPTINRWLIDNYPVSEVSQYSKDEILDLVNKLILRLNEQITQSGPKAFLLSLLDFIRNSIPKL